MKLNYYGYSVQKFSNSRKYLMDIRPFLHAFCDYDDPVFKNSFTHNGEHVYLFPVMGNVFLFLMTRSNEAFKKIKPEDLSIAEIYDLLDRGEMIGVASYVYVDKHFFGIASSAMAPRAKAFGDFVNNMLDAVDIDDYLFAAHPLLTQASKQDAMNMAFMGRATIQIDKQNSVFEDFMNTVNGNAQDFNDVDSIEITIKPRARKNIDDAVKKVIASVPDDGLEKMLIRAKEDLHGPLVDLYLAGKGGVFDTINARDERLIYNEMIGKVKGNAVLKTKVKEHEADKEFKTKNIKDIDSFADASDWADHLSPV